VSIPAVLYTLSSVPIFASRPFLAAFVTALLARYGVDLPWIGDSRSLVALHGAPAWLQSPVCLAVLGVLALLELLSAKSPEVRQVLDEVDGIVKAVVSALVALALIDADTARTLESIQKVGILGSTWAVLVGGVTFVVAGLRRRVVEALADIDEGDDLGLLALLAWAENAWALLGLLFLVLFPVAALVLAALTLLGIALVQRLVLRAEERSKVPCAGCGAPVFAHASECPRCGRALDAPRAVGVFGQPRRRPAPERASQAFVLAMRKRCPRCATRLRRRAVSQGCPTCGRVTFADAAELERHLARLQARLPRTLLVCLGLGAIPLLGVVPGVVYYRLNLVVGLRGYVPPLRGCASRWLVRVLHVLVVALQPLPLVGAFALPLLCWSTYAIYRRALVGRARVELATSAARA
jgi:predicted RNA-binding Zn-ribbon protein involved in translation (DUF1610 family)